MGAAAVGMVVILLAASPNSPAVWGAAAAITPTVYLHALAALDEAVGDAVRLPAFLKVSSSSESASCPREQPHHIGQRLS